MTIAIGGQLSPDLGDKARVTLTIPKAISVQKDRLIEQTPIAYKTDK